MQPHPVGARSLYDCFLLGARIRPEAAALVVDGQSLTYSECEMSSLALAAGMEHDPLALIAVLGSRSKWVYLAILGVLASGKGYVPLNPKHPLERIVGVLRASGVRSVLVCPESEDVGRSLQQQTQNEFAFLDVAQLLRTQPLAKARDSSADGIAYLLFTSGTTGQPKGVAIRNRNVAPYIEATCRRLGLTEFDKYSQMFDLSFDLSVHDLFVSWRSGGCLFVVPQAELAFPANFIRSHGLTVWFSVPSVVSTMARIRLLKPNAFPSLRISLFCGEAFPQSFAEMWHAASPSSIIENLYGPTEATIAICWFRWHPDVRISATGLVPIGKPFDGQQAVISDGELVLGGPQVADGYFFSSDEEQKRFFKDESDGLWWYRTGDLVRIREDGDLDYVGRMDSQIKLAGHRIELAEIEEGLRICSGFPSVAALACPPRSPTPTSIYAFVEAASLAEDAVLTSMKERLPEYMIPRRIIAIENMPLNSNGKIDRNKLKDILEAQIGPFLCQ